VTRIVQLTDLHLFSDPDERLFGIPTRELLVDVVDHIARHAGRVDHLVITGDLTHDELHDAYDAIRSIVEPWADRLWPVPGNHDDRAALRATFADRVAGGGADPVRFAFGEGAWLCLGLDSQVPGRVAGLMDEAQVDWIHARIEEHDPSRIALFLHHPPVVLGSDWLDPIGLDGRELLHELLHDEPRIRLVCSGHVHLEAVHRVASATVVTTPSTGLQFSLAGETARFDHSPPGYRIVDLDGDRFTTHVVRLGEARFAPSRPGFD
jgi:3',5'-cyclic-AMP phosphodiesterase